MLALVVASTTLQSQLAMGFTLPLSCQRLGPPTTLTTWVGTLYVRPTNSLECQDAILTWILTKLYNEAPPRTLWNYVLSMRNQHELPLTGVMELRPDHEAPPHNHRGITSWPMRHHHEISPRNSWNYVLTMRHHHATIVELRPDQWGTTMKPLWNYDLTIPKIMSHPPSIKLSCIPISCEHS